MAPDSDVELAVLRLAWRLDALDEWRKEIERRVAHNTAEIARLLKADEIAEAVADAVSERVTETAQRQIQAQTRLLQAGSFRLTKWQTWAALAGVFLTGAGLVLTALAHAGAL